MIFGVLHHIPDWRSVIRECARVLRDGGKLFVEEPGGGILAKWEPLLHFGHPTQGVFYLRDIEQELADNGLMITRKVKWPGFGVYAGRKQ